MEPQVELEICANCKREIPHTNYVMHTAHCSRNITLCSVCKEPILRADFEKHSKQCVLHANPKKKEPPSKLEQSDYFKARQEIVDKRTAVRQSKRLERLERFVSSGSSTSHVATSITIPIDDSPKLPVYNYSTPIETKASLLPCQYCELELPKFDLGEHETYCGARTEKCEECGENVMFRDRNVHRDSGHRMRNGLKSTSSPREQRRPLNSFDVPSFSNLSLSGGASASKGEKRESSRDISRRLDCKTEYIRNLLHDSASIVAPLRSTGAIPRNKSAAARRNPPTEIVIPCEFCHTPIPHEDLIQHETGCRPDLAKYNPRRRDSSPDVYPSREARSPDVDIPCEYCSDLIPASQFLTHQATCSCN